MTEAVHRTTLSVIQMVMAASAPELRPDGAAVDGMELRPEKAVGDVDGVIVDRAET